LFKNKANITFDKIGDEMPKDRHKYNHARGVLAKVLWVDTLGHPYTGFYKGNSEGIIRMSEGNFVDLPEAPGMTPTFAMKFLRTKMKSVNLLANTSFEPNNPINTPAGTSAFDFFAKPFSSSIPLFKGNLD